MGRDTTSLRDHARAARVAVTSGMCVTRKKGGGTAWGSICVGMKGG